MSPADIGSRLGGFSKTAMLNWQTRSGCSYLKNTSMDEFNLFKEFFLSGEPQL